jgi:hypothetical protein
MSGKGRFRLGVRVESRSWCYPMGRGHLRKDEGKEARFCSDFIFAVDVVRIFDCFSGLPDEHGQ